MYQRLLVDRNRNWLPKIEALFARKGRAFVVVGAAHLVGPDGLLAMLEPGLHHRAALASADETRTHDRCSPSLWRWRGRGMPAQQRTIDDFFETFTAEWVRGNPNLATSTRYFTGDEQERLERQLTPVSLSGSVSGSALARKGLDELRAFDRRRMTESRARVRRRDGVAARIGRPA